MMHRYTAVSAALALSLILAFASAQFGESAGALSFNVSLGSSGYLNYTLFNQGSAPMGFSIVFQGFNPIKNTTTPTVIISPMNGTIGPHQSTRITVMVQMPDNKNNLNARWDGLIQAIEQQYNVSSGGAVVYAGLGKEIVITASPYKGIPLVYIIAGAAITAAAGGAVYYRGRRLKSAARKRAAAAKRPARPAAAKKKAVRKPAARKRAAKKKAAVRKPRAKAGSGRTAAKASTRKRKAAARPARTRKGAR